MPTLIPPKERRPEMRCWFCRTNKSVKYEGHIINPCPWAENRFLHILLCKRCAAVHESSLAEYWTPEAVAKRKAADEASSQTRDYIICCLEENEEVTDQNYQFNAAFINDVICRYESNLKFVDDEYTEAYAINDAIRDVLAAWAEMNTIS